MEPDDFDHERVRCLQERLIAWANLNSASDNLEGLAQMAEVLLAAVSEITPHVALVPISGDGRAAVQARMRPKAPIQVLLAGHYDTVYGLSHPFQTCRPCGLRGRLNGPGVADMKGGIVLILEALAAFERGLKADGVGWEVLLTPDEETGSRDSAPLWREASRRHHLGLVFEPARDNGDTVLGRKGVGRALVTSRGRAAHAGTVPSPGRNAIAALCAFLATVDRLPAEMPALSVNIGLIRGGGPVNIVPDFAEAQLDLRIDRPADIEWLNARLLEAALPINSREGYRIDVEVQFAREPWEADAACRSAFAAWHQCGQDLGVAPFWFRQAGGGSDANLLSAAGLTCLDGLGPIGGNYHTVDEWVDLRSIVDRAQLAALFLDRLATGKIPLAFARR